jgi:hypothetical protein
VFASGRPGAPGTQREERDVAIKYGGVDVEHAALAAFATMTKAIGEQ